MMRLEDEGRRRLVERSQHLFNSHGITRDIFTLVSDQVLSDRPRNENYSNSDHVRQHSHIVSATIVNTSPVHRGEIALHEIARETPPPLFTRSSLTASPISLRNMPPPYDTLTKPDIEAPPPTYSEAIALMAQHKETNENVQSTE